MKWHASAPCVVAFAMLALCFFGVPVQARERITARDLATLTDLEGVSVSPDGAWVAFMTRQANPETNDYTQTWHVMSTRGGAPRRIADAGEAIPTVFVRDWIWPHGYLIAPAPVWTPDSASILYPRRLGGRTQMWRARADGGGAEQLTHLEDDVHEGSALGQNRRIALTQDGRGAFFTTRLSNAQFQQALNREARTGFLFDDRFLPAYSRRPMGLNDVDLASSWVFEFRDNRARRVTDSEAREYEALMTAPGPPEGRAQARGAPSVSMAGSLAWLEARDPEQQGMRPPLTLMVRAGGDTEAIICGDPVCTSQSLSIVGWRGDQEVLFTYATHERPAEKTLYAWRPGAAPRELWRTSGIYRDCAVAAERLICAFEELNRPRRLLAINLDTGAVETLFDPNPQWRRFDLGRPPELIRTTLSNGAETRSYLVLPPNYRPGQRLPLIVNAYSCQDFYDMRGAIGDEYPVFPFAAQGFAVLCHTLFPLDWARAAREADGGLPQQFGPADADMRLIQDGVDAAIDELDRRGIIDTRRIAITGLSAGGQSVEYALIHMPRLTAAISSGSHLTTATHYMAYPTGREEFRRAGFESSASPRYDTRSISRNASRIRAPLLMNLSEEDFETESVVSLRAAGRAVEMFVYPDENHIKNQPAHRLAIYNRNIDWMNFWLRGVESGLSGDTSQYARWRALREEHCRQTAEDPPWFCRQARAS